MQTVNEIRSWVSMARLQVGHLRSGFGSRETNVSHGTVYIRGNCVITFSRGAAFSRMVGRLPFPSLVLSGYVESSCENRRAGKITGDRYRESACTEQVPHQGLVVNMPEFEKAFSCKAGQPMMKGNCSHLVITCLRERRRSCTNNSAHSPA